MKEKLELYEEEIEKVSNPIWMRLDHYRKVMYEIRKLLNAFFFDVVRTQKLTEAPEGDLLVFTFNSVKEMMQKCLVEESILVENAQKIQGSSKHPSLTIALDSNVVSCGLPIELHEKGLYIFTPAKSYTPTAQAFMQQFAYGLSIYRVGLGICDVYFSLYFNKFLQVEEIKNYIEMANNLEKKLDGEVNLISLHRQACAIEKEINGLLKIEKLHEGLDDFKKESDYLTCTLLELLENAATHLQECYKKFPNDPILWFLHDRSWHALIKTLSMNLYFNQYTYSTLSGTLEIYKGIIDTIKVELNQFSKSILAHIPLLKIELLGKAAKLITEVKIKTLTHLSEKGTALLAPKVGIFSDSAKQPLDAAAAVREAVDEDAKIEIMP